MTIRAGGIASTISACSTNGAPARAAPFANGTPSVMA
jgi:hypothetical protein